MNAKLSELVTKQEAAQLLGAKHVSTVNHLRLAGRLTAVGELVTYRRGGGRQILFNRKDVELIAAAEAARKAALVEKRRAKPLSRKELLGLVAKLQAEISAAKQAEGGTH